MTIDKPFEVEIIEGLLRDSLYPRDALPYTPEFKNLKKKYEETVGVAITNHEFWNLICRVGKKGGLKSSATRKKGPASKSISEWDKLEVLRLFPDGIGRRDQLPYTKRFDNIYNQFNSLTALNLTKYEFWRAVSGVAKRSRKPKPIFDSVPLGGLMSDTVDFLERNNPWWKAQPQKQLPSLLRWAYKEVHHLLHSGLTQVVVLKGPRQVGKTTIQQQLIDHLLRLDQVLPSRILRVQFDETPSLGVLKNPIETIVKWFERNVLKCTLNQAASEGKQAYLLFDEVQNLPNWSEQIKSLVDHSSVKVFVTGSSALRIQKGNDSLAGRLSTVKLGPLRLSEISKLRSLETVIPFSHPSKVHEWNNFEFWTDFAEYGKRNLPIIDNAFRYFSLYGGYPVGHKQNIDVELLATQIVKDVVDRTISHEAADGAEEDVVKELFNQVCICSGERVTIKHLTDRVNIRLGRNIKQANIFSALKYLEKTLLVCKLEPLQLLRKKSHGQPTLCLCDHFIRYAVTGESIPLVPRVLKDREQAISTQAGHIIEGIFGSMFSFLPCDSVTTFPGRQAGEEVDIVVSVKLQRVPIEIKYRNNFSLKDLSGLKSFCGKPQYESPFGIVVTQEKAGKVADNIVAIPAKTMLALV